MVELCEVDGCEREAEISFLHYGYKGKLSWLKSWPAQTHLCEEHAKQACAEIGYEWKDKTALE